MQKYTCPCCGYKTLESDGHFDICEICFWEDDPYQEFKPYDGYGANHVSLAEAQNNYITFGACDKNGIDNVRKPTHDEKRDANWKPVKEDVRADNLFELKLTCRKFKQGIYSIVELGRSLAWIDVPNEFVHIVKDAENQLEMIRFCSSDYKQQEEADEVVKRLQEQLNIEIED
ncbi:hypothetical protein GK047_01190 [Paenibacillus sp. SYP-B3998]|uniref:Cysteine-rich CPCC domain-containing protein n=1 Tax=Paenibacillus sp. SYP-B3998 TaxID=2678564 RepID=A0A6G3ZSS2_9BACL|nr:hypothetical protein [Paenibacillus sp. SYP-B3998]